MLKDTNAESFGGYFVGYPDNGEQPKILTLGKSTENNADIFAAFSLLAQIETTRDNASAAAQWASAADVAGDFVVQMFDPTKGRFNTGTVSFDPPSPSDPAAGNCQTVPPIQKGNDILNICDFLDSDSFTSLAMAAAMRYQNINWVQPLSYVLDLTAPPSFSQTVVAQGLTFMGFDIVPAPPATGISWEFTGQTAETCEYLYALLKVPAFQQCFETYGPQILQAQNNAPFGGGLGVPSSTLQNGDQLPPLLQCLNSPFQCFPERVGLAASDWAIFSGMGFNPLAYAAVGISPASLTFPDQAVGAKSTSMTLSLTSTANGPVNGISISIIGANASDFSEQDTCPKSSPMTGGASCTISVAFTPGAAGPRTAMLQISDNALGSPQTAVLSGSGVPPIDFSLSVNPQMTAVTEGSLATYTVTAAGNAALITLSGSSAPAGAVLTFNPSAISSGGASILTVVPEFSNLPGSYTLTITGTGPESTHQVSTTLAVSGATGLSPASLSFGNLVIGASGPSQTVTLTNTSTSSALNLAGILLTGVFYGDYAETNNCASSLNPGASCTINVSFHPSGTGARAAVSDGGR